MQYNDIANESWGATDTLAFQVKGEVAAKPIELMLRNTANYPFQNIWIDIAVDNNDFKRYEMLLAAPSGHWIGKKSGKFYTTMIPLDVQLPTDSSTIKIVHLMRTNQLEGVQAVGIGIE